MSKSERFARVLVKRTNIPGLSATTAPSVDHTLLPRWETTDIYKGEFFMNLDDEKLWIRTENNIRRVLFENDITISGVSHDYYVVSGSYDSVTSSITLLRNDGGEIEITGITSETPYVNSAVVPETVGGISVGTTFPLPGKTMQEMWNMLLYPYQYPAFTSFAISGEISSQEIGDGWYAGNRTFTWATSNSSNVETNSISISGYNLITLTSQPNDGSQIGTFTADVISGSSVEGIGTRTWYINGLNNSGTSMTQRTHSIRWNWRWYWGTSSTTSLTESQIESLTSNGLYSAYSRTYAFGGSNYKYLCFADVYGGPSNFVDNLTGFAVAMYGGYVNVENGFSYDLVSVTNSFGKLTNYRVYRTMHKIMSDINIIVS